MEEKQKFRFATRGLVVKNDQLLFVSDDQKYWYLPGGRLEHSETLVECLEREVYEETGLVIKAKNLLHVLECFDLNDKNHKVHFYFQTELIEGEIAEDWQDKGGMVKFRQYFSLAEIKAQSNILPRFLASGDWLKEYANAPQVYQGLVMMRGFEMMYEA